MAVRHDAWRKIPVALTELCLDTTLRCGQSFRWRKSGDDEWSCTLHGRIVTLRQDATHLYYRARYAESTEASSSATKSSVSAKKPKARRSAGSVLPTPPASQAPSPAHFDTLQARAASRNTQSGDNDDTEALLRRYFNLSVDLASLYQQWSEADGNFAAKAPRFAGVRILRQDAWEALVGFICSSNNNIVRIAQMVHKLCAEYGQRLGTVQHTQTVLREADGSSPAGSEELKPEIQTDEVAYYDFPRPEALAQAGVEATLRRLGFGYRARYIYETACMIQQREAGWLESLRNPENPALGSVQGGDSTGADKELVEAHAAGVMQPQGRDGYLEARTALLELQGVGPKVADCVCLMGLGWGEAVPVDTHVWQIAVRDYRFKGASKTASLTPALYAGVGARFRELWGAYAGWAHSVLFTADLRAFSEQLKGVVKVERVAGGKKLLKEATTTTKTESNEARQDATSGKPTTITTTTTNVEVVDRTVRVKRELDDGATALDRRQVVEVHEDMASRVKRRRRGQV